MSFVGRDVNLIGNARTLDLSLVWKGRITDIWTCENRFNMGEPLVRCGWSQRKRRLTSCIAWPVCRWFQTRTHARHSFFPPGLSTRPRMNSDVIWASEWSDDCIMYVVWWTTFAYWRIPAWCLNDNVYCDVLTCTVHHLNVTECSCNQLRCFCLKSLRMQWHVSMFHAYDLKPA